MTVSRISRKRMTFRYQSPYRSRENSFGQRNHSIYAGEKVIVLCHRLVLEQLGGLAEHKVCKLNLNHSEKAFADYDVLRSTSTRARDILDDAVEQAKLIIIDEALRIAKRDGL